MSSNSEVRSSISDGGSTVDSEKMRVVLLLMLASAVFGCFNEKSSEFSATQDCFFKLPV